MLAHMGRSRTLRTVALVLGVVALICAWSAKIAYDRGNPFIAYSMRAAEAPSGRWMVAFWVFLGAALVAGIASIATRPEAVDLQTPPAAGQSPVDAAPTL